MKSFTSHSLEETEQIAKDWLVAVSNKYSDRDEALVVGLSGHLGAGKTAFTKCVAKLLEVNDTVTSPTFVIMKIYSRGSNGGNEPRGFDEQISERIEIPWKRLIHIDAYRLERREELEVLEWEKLIEDKNNLILIEWPENVGLKDFESLAHIYFEAEGEGRKISY